MTPQHRTRPTSPDGVTGPSGRTTTDATTDARALRAAGASSAAGGVRRWAPLLAAVLLAPVLAGCGPDAGAATPSASLTASVESPSDPTPTESATETTPAVIPTVTAAPLTPTRPTPTSAATTTAGPDAGPDAGSTAGSCTRTLDTYPTLEPGATGPAVSALQCFLDDADFGPVRVDGRYGAATRAAVARVESTLEAPVSHPGRVDNSMWVIVISRSLGDRTLKPGAKGADVTTLQRALRAAGATLAVDGVFGPGTTKAVETLQAANRIGVDGIVGDETLFLLKSGATIG